MESFISRLVWWVKRMLFIWLLNWFNQRFFGKFSNNGKLLTGFKLGKINSKPSFLWDHFQLSRMYPVWRDWFHKGVNMGRKESLQWICWHWVSATLLIWGLLDQFLNIILRQELERKEHILVHWHSWNCDQFRVLNFRFKISPNAPARSFN